MYQHYFFKFLFAFISMNVWTVSVNAQCGLNDYNVQYCKSIFDLQTDQTAIDGYTVICSDSEQVKNNFKTCLNDTGCESTWTDTYKPAIAKAELQSTSLICNPSSSCNFLELMRCYETLLSQLSVTIPTDNTQTATFLDNLVTNFYGNLDKVCSEELKVPSNIDTCLQEKSATLVTNCLTEQQLTEAGTTSSEQQNRIKSSFAGGSLFQQSLIDQMKTAVCNKECSSFDTRYATGKKCKETFFDDLLDSFQKLGNTNGFCTIIKEYIDCAGSSSKGCPLLTSDIENNRYVKAKASGCGYNVRSMIENSQSPNSAARLFDITSLKVLCLLVAFVLFV